MTTKVMNMDGVFESRSLAGVSVRYMNKCVDGVSGLWTFWVTVFQDREGVQYPGESFDSGTYKVQTILYDRVQ
jgi:hypothetical protein